MKHSFAFAALGGLVAIVSCNGTAGGELIRFSAYAEGAPAASQPFAVGAFSVVLTSAHMRIGAVYANSAPENMGSQAEACTKPGLYVAQVPGGVEVDLLNPAPQLFSVFGNGTNDSARSWELWLTDGDINAPSNLAHMVDVQGVATRTTDGAQFPFAAVVTIDGNRSVVSSDPSQPGLDPICKRRVVDIAPIDVQFFQGGSLYVTVDPTKWFSLGVDFSELPPVAASECLLDPDVDFGSAQFCIPDTDQATSSAYCAAACAAAGRDFFTGILTGGTPAYSLRFSTAP